MWRCALIAVAMSMAAAGPAAAQIAVSANDDKVKLVDGKVVVQKDPPPDTVSIIDLRANPPQVLAEIEVPNSVVGPPLNVAVSPREDIALITSNQSIDPADPSKTSADDKLTVDRACSR